jgi:predicted ester cyclase
MSEQNKAVFRRIVDEVFNQGRLATADELGAGYIEHTPAPGQAPGIEGFKQMVQMLRGAFPDLRVTIEDLIAEGDRVVARMTTSGTHRGEFMGLAPSGKRFTISEIHILRVANGKVLEHWGVADDFGMLQQLGAVPAGVLPQA